MNAKEITLKYELRSNGWDYLWKVYWGDTLLLQTKDEKQAREAYEYHKANPPKRHKLEEIIF